MIMKEKAILEALQTADIAAVAASIMSSLPIKAVGRTFDAPNDHRYLEIIHIPNNVLNEFWGSEKTYRGLHRLILHWGLDDAGAYPPIDVIASIANYFSKDATYTNSGVSVKITEEPDLTGVIEAPPELLFPVTIRYASFQP